jgi:acyl-CoA synthetase (AMP-forming)/AMP-acid ligase II/peptidoglycan/LPS O-acetylase OafA/YrhL
MFHNLESHLYTIAPDAIVAKDGINTLTYSELLAKAKQVKDTIGLQRQLVILECNPSIDWLIAYVGIILGGHVPILLPNDQQETIDFFNNKFNPNCVIKTFPTIEVRRCHHHQIPLHKDLCLMLSTSGSTGSPKCVKLSHKNLNSNSSAIAEYLNITQYDVGTVNLPTNYSFGLSIVNSHIYMGGTILFNHFSMVDDEFWDLCTKEGATSFAGVPHSYDLLSRIDFESKIPDSIRYFTQAGGKLAKDKVEKFAKFATSRNSEFFVMYGQTEASPRISYLPPKLAQTYPTSIGVPVPGGKLSIIGDDGMPLPIGVDGELVYEGPNVMMGYALSQSDLDTDDETKLLKTGDIAKQLENGLFVITGRKSRFIKVFGNRISLDQVEVLLNEEGHRCIATGIDEQLLVVTTEERKQSIIESFLSKRLKLPKSAILVQYVEEFPTLATGKMDYASLIRLLETKKNNESLHRTQSIKEVFASVFGTDADDVTKSFIDLGGDSLTFVSVSIELEELLEDLPENWSHLCISDLEKIAASNSTSNESNIKTKSFNRLSNVDTLRAIVCILVVAFHVFGNNSDFGLKFDDDSPYRAGFEVLGLLRMPLFTALAGMLFVAMAPTIFDFPTIVKHKALTLIVPAVLVTVVYFILRMFVNKESDDLSVALFFGYLHLWYLYALFIITLVIGAIHIFLKPNLLAYLGLMLLFFLISTLINSIYPLRIDEAVRLAPYFIMGILLYQYSNKWMGQKLLAIAIAITLFGSVLKICHFIGVANVHESETVLWLIVSISFIFVIYRLVPKITTIEWIGIYTYAIYLWHPLANASVRTLLMKFGVEDRLVLFIIGLIVGVFIPIIMYKIAQLLPKIVRQSLMGR